MANTVSPIQNSHNNSFSRSHNESAESLAQRCLSHLLAAVDRAQAIHEPFSHIYFTDLFPADVYQNMLAALPALDEYDLASERYRVPGEIGGFVRRQYALTVQRLTESHGARERFWRGVSAALTMPELKNAVYTKLAKDLAYRYSTQESQVADLVGHTRPTLYRETEGFEIPPHPDTRKKVVTMQLYLPADDSQKELGTALYRRRTFALPIGGWRNRFQKVKQFAFLPNSGYAFVVNNTIGKRSWHGRERLPTGAGVRNSLLNTFYEQVDSTFVGYFESGADRQAA